MLLQSAKAPSHGYVGDWAFLQQKFGGLYSAVTMEPPLHDIIAEEVGQREQAHSLVMNHPRSNDFEAPAKKTLASWAEVGSFAESV